MWELYSLLTDSAQGQRAVSTNRRGQCQLHFHQHHLYTMFLVMWLMLVISYLVNMCTSICYVCLLNIWHMWHVCLIWWVYLYLAHQVDVALCCILAFMCTNGNLYPYSMLTVWATWVNVSVIFIQCYMSNICTVLLVVWFQELISYVVWMYASPMFKVHQYLAYMPSLVDLSFWNIFGNSIWNRYYSWLYFGNYRVKILHLYTHLEC